MANKIVQLQDKDGNNVFPIAGGMAADSITTTMLQDGAATADKIDFTTQSFSDSGVSYQQFGKIVIGSVVFSPSSTISMQQFDGNPYIITTLDAKPTTAVSVPVWAMNSSNGSVGQNLFLLIDTNGRVYIRNFTATTCGVASLRANFAFIAS